MVIKLLKIRIGICYNQDNLIIIRVQYNYVKYAIKDWIYENNSYRNELAEMLSEVIENERSEEAF